MFISQTFLTFIYDIYIIIYISKLYEKFDTYFSSYSLRKKVRLAKKKVTCVYQYLMIFFFLSTWLLRTFIEELNTDVQ